MDPLIVLDIFMALAALTVGIWSVRIGDVKRAVGATVVFGLLAGVIWIRTAAHELLLAEAVVGAMLSALLLGSVLARLSYKPDSEKDRQSVAIFPRRGEFNF